MKKFLLSLLGCAALSGVCGDFFALPADKGKDLPADKVYPKGRIFPIMTYSGRNPAQYKKDGFTVIGPIYGKVDRDKVYSNTELPIIYSIRATQDGRMADKDFIRRSGIKMNYKKLAQSVREDVKEAIKKYPHIAYFYLTPEELRWWKKNEYDFIKVVTDAAHEADPENVRSGCICPATTVRIQLPNIPTVWMLSAKDATPTMPVEKISGHGCVIRWTS